VGALHLDGKERPTRKKTVIGLGYRDPDPLMFASLRGGMLQYRGSVGWFGQSGPGVKSAANHPK
jgi:hypothetical protein